MKSSLKKILNPLIRWWSEEISVLPTKIKWGLLICLLAGASIVKVGEEIFSKVMISWEGHQVQEVVTSKEQRIAVTAAALEKRDISQVFNVFGHIKPLKEIQISSDDGMSVSHVFVKWGQKVKKGEPLFQVDSRIHQLRTKLQNMEGQIRQQELEVISSLAEKEIISKNEFKQKKQELESSKIRNQITKLESKAGKIISPIDGVIAEIKMKVGDYVDDPQKFYIKVVDLSELRFETWVPLDIASRINFGDSVDFEWKRTAARLGEEEQAEIETGVVDGVSPMIDAQSGTVMVTVSLKDLFNNWKSGIYVKAAFPLEKKQSALAIKNSSLIYDKGQAYAYRIIASEQESFAQAEKVPVKLGISDGEYSEVMEGLSQSEKVVDKGVGTVTPDMPIEVIKN
jgi:RND family efflux transporter MFP subunit